MKPLFFFLSCACLLGIGNSPLGQGISSSTPVGGHALIHPQHQGGAQVWYVDHSATGNASGLSWQQAFVDLQNALAAASQGDEIWVAQGSYVPVPPGGSETISFDVPGGVAIYGGFDGSETSRAQRDPLANPTNLSGDINGDDTYSPVFNISTGNTDTILRMTNASASTRLDGFTVIGGHDGSGGTTGAGLALVNSSPVIANCDFSYNVATDGGAINVNLGSPQISNCSFSNNFASSSSAQGGALRNDGGTLAVMDCNFTNNHAEGLVGAGFGGGIYSQTGSTFIDRCTFSANDALPRVSSGSSLSTGGGVHVNSGFVQISECYFSGNTAHLGGAVANSLFAPSTCQILNSCFVSNTALPLVLSSGFDLGAEGGSIYASAGSTMDLFGCLVYGSSADNYGGAFSGGNDRISSSIFWNNSDAKGDIGVSQIKASLVEYCCVMNMLVGEPGEDPPDPTKFPGSIALDPRFSDALNGDFHLLSISPCIDAADNSAWPSFVTSDYDGNPRFVDDASVIDTGVGPAPICDMGPLEKQ